MPRFAKRMLVLLGLTGAVYATAAASDVWRAGEYRQQVEEHEELSHQLDASLDDTRFRLEAKESLATDYAAGRLTFREVAERFQELHAASAAVMQQFHDVYPATDDREIAALNAIEFIRATCPIPSPARTSLETRLHADFQSLFPQADPHRSE